MSGWEDAARRLFSELDDARASSDELYHFADLLHSSRASDSRITKDDVEWFRVYAFLSAKLEARENGLSNEIGAGEWRDIQASYEKLEFLVEELASVRSITKPQWYLGGGAMYDVLDEREFRRLISRKGLHRLKDLGIAKAAAPLLKPPVTGDFSANLRPVRPFISYSSKQSRIAEPLAERLQTKGLDAWLDKWEIAYGDSIPHQLEKGILQSNALLILVSPDYATSPWTRAEYETALAEQMKSGKLRVIPVLVEDGRPEHIPPFLRSLKYADLRGVNPGTSAFETKADEIAGALLRWTGSNSDVEKTTLHYPGGVPPPLASPAQESSEERLRAKLASVVDILDITAEGRNTATEPIFQAFEAAAEIYQMRGYVPKSKWLALKAKLENAINKRGITAISTNSDKLKQFHDELARHLDPGRVI